MLRRCTAGFSTSPSGSSLHTTVSFPPVTVVHEAPDVVSSTSFIFLEDSEHTSSISPATEDEHDSTDMVSRGPVQCLIALDPPNLCNILALSLSLSHRDRMCFFSVQVRRLLLTFSLPTPSSPRRPFHSTFRSLYSAVNSCLPPSQPGPLVFRQANSPPASDPDSAFPAPPILSVVCPTSPNWRCAPHSLLA